MSTENTVGVARTGYEESSDEGTPAVANEVFIPDYVMQDFGFLPGEKDGLARRSRGGQRDAGSQGDIA